MAELRAYRRRRPNKRRRKKKRRAFASRERISAFVANVGVFCFTLAIGVAIALIYFAQDLPDTNVLWKKDPVRKVTILAADGSPLAVHGASAGAPVRLADLPDHVPAAVIAVEDRNFYHHLGFNPVSIVRALMVNARDGAIRQGGSTITQQLAKNIFLTPQRTLRRKVQELLLALWLEQRFSKEEILTLYLNRVYFGAGAYGVDAASHRYFGKSAADLTVAEAAVLAGLLKAPSRLAPTSNPESAGHRARLVLEKMAETGALTPAEVSFWSARPVRLRPSRFDVAPYFVDHVVSELDRLVPGVEDDVIIRTTLHPKLQQAADVGLAAGAAQYPNALSDVQAAVVLLDRDGAVRAMIGGRDYALSQFNRASRARRQPGSAFKPFVFLAALENGLSADDRVQDAPVTIRGWSPDNYNSEYFGQVTLREALARSLNGATIRLQEYVGRDQVRRVANALGAPRPLNAGPSLALGVDEMTPLELAGAYAALANGGMQVKPFAIHSVATTDGTPLYRMKGSIVAAGASPRNVEALNDMMAAVSNWGTGKKARLVHFPVYGKTGTSQNYRDAWFAGHANGLTGVVWVGRDDNRPMDEVTGGGPPSVIWREIMSRGLDGAPVHLAPVQAVING